MYRQSIAIYPCEDVQITLADDVLDLDIMVSNRQAKFIAIDKQANDDCNAPLKSSSHERRTVAVVIVSLKLSRGHVAQS